VFDTPLGKVTFRGSDHQSSLGTYVGTLTKVDGAGRMQNFVYKDGAAHLPPDSVIRRLRPAEPDALPSR
jgi:branched-chain amino acid transport system substrate-binding protein